MSEKYDVVIIGAGIGGLVCGCYLAKAGLKVLIVEQQDKPGGYCTSFERDGYRFDVGVHYLGSVKKGIMRHVLDELEIDLKLNRIDPCDKIIMPENVTCIRTNLVDTMQEFKTSFPGESKNVENFFGLIFKDDFLTVYRKAKRLTFIQVLDEFFKDHRLKATLSLLLGNIGLSAKIAAAVPSIILFREYIFDCGYYPIGGMQAFPDALVSRLSSYGGQLLLSRKVLRIIHDNTYKKVILNNDDEIITKTVVSNADATETYKSLLDIKSKEFYIVDTLTHSSSMFLVYLGLRINLESILEEKANVWYFSTYDIDRVYSYMAKNIIKSEEDLECVLYSFPSLHGCVESNCEKSTVIIFIHAPYKSEEFWEKYKNVLGEMMISKASEVIKDFKKYIDVKIYATPVTFRRYTSNKDGSFVGWLSTLKQINTSLLPQRTSINGIYTVGHWSSMGYPGYGGIPNVAFSGRRGAMLVLKDLNKKWDYKEIKL